MVDLTFVYDYPKKSWKVCQDEHLNNMAINEMQWTLLIKYNYIVNRDYMYGDADCGIDYEEYLRNGRLIDYWDKLTEIRNERDIKQSVYCPIHKELEVVADITDGKVISERGCSFGGIVATAYLEEAYSTSQIDEVIYVPFRWRIRQSARGKVVTIIGDLARVSQLYSSVIVAWRSLSISLDMEKRRTIVTNPEFFCALNKNEIEDLPEPVVDATLDILMQEGEKFLGFKPTVLSKMHGYKKLAAFVERPYDLNIVFLKHFMSELQEKSFHEIFPYDAKDNFRILCGILKLNPPKSLRKAYTFNPFAMIWYVLLKTWGVEDVNLMQPFFSLQKNVMIWPLENLCLARKDKEIVILLTAVKGSSRQHNRGRSRYGESKIFRHIHENNWSMYPSRWDIENWESICSYIKWLIKTGTPQRAMKWVYKVTLEQPKMGWEAFDTIRFVLEYNDELSDEIKKLVRRKGLIRHVHDEVSVEVRRIEARRKNVIMDYPQEIADYEGELKGYEFYVVKETKVLADLGYAFDNCVAGYRRDVIEKISVIVYMKRDDEYLACIEIRHGALVQALGKNNHRLQGEPLMICREWAELHELPVKTEDLNLPRDT